MLNPFAFAAFSFLFHCFTAQENKHSYLTGGGVELWQQTLSNVNQSRDFILKELHPTCLPFGQS